jgi:hypothetical protein
MAAGAGSRAWRGARVQAAPTVAVAPARPAHCLDGPAGARWAVKAPLTPRTHPGCEPNPPPDSLGCAWELLVY